MQLFFKIIFLLFLIVISIDPTGNLFHAKELFFVVLCVCGLFYCVKGKVKISYFNILALLFVVFLPLYGYMVCCINGNMRDPEYAVSQFKAFLFAFIVFYLLSIKVSEIQKCLFVSGTLLAITTILIYIYMSIMDEYFEILYNLAIDSANFMVAKRTFLGVDIFGVYFRAGPLIFFSYLYSLYFYKGKSKLLLCLMNFLSLLIAGSRTPVLLVILITFIYFYDNKIGGKYFFKLITAILVIGLFCFTLMLATEKGESSNELKYGNVYSYIDDISKGGNIIFGAGLGSVFYAQGNSEFLSFTELSYFDLYRIYGFFMSSLFVFILLYPAIICFKNKHIPLREKRYMLGYCLYMILAGTNPLLFGSTGMLVFALGLRYQNAIVNNELKQIA